MQYIGHEYVKKYFINAVITACICNDRLVLIIDYCNEAKGLLKLLSLSTGDLH